MLWGVISAEGWLELIPLELVTFNHIGLADDTSDREVWRFAQENEMILLTANRRMQGKDNLEQTIREENTLTSLPVLTIGNADRVAERPYRDRCAARIVEIALDLRNYLGTGRLFIP